MVLRKWTEGSQKNSIFRQNDKEETTLKQQPTPKTTITIATPLRTSPQNVVTVQTTPQERSSTATISTPAQQEEPSPSTSTSEKSTIPSYKRKRTDAFSTLRDEDVQELFVDDSSKEKKTKQSRDTTYKWKCNIQGNCRKCGQSFTQLDNLDCHERDCGGNNFIHVVTVEKYSIGNQTTHVTSKYTNNRQFYNY